MKTLKDICLFLEIDTLALDIDLLHLYLDSREVSKNSVFIALQGEKYHGLDYAKLSCQQGAKLILVDKKITELSGVNVPIIFVNKLAEKLADLSAWFYNQPTKHMKIVGVTGTNGKTSVVHYVAQICNKYKKVAVLGTLGNGIFGQLEPSINTTLNTVSLHRKLAEFTSYGVEIVLMEVSSHAIALQRIKGLSFFTLALTQVTSDHLDFHGSLEEYQKTKKRLFTDYPSKNWVVNVDDALGLFLKENATENVNVVSYGLSNETDIYVDDIEYLSTGLQAKINNNLVKTCLFGYFNLENIMCAIAICKSLNLSIPEIFDQLNFMPVAGRMEVVSTSPTIVVDYAHTEDGLRSVLISAQQHFNQLNQKLILVFGCGGDRDKSKRPLMGEVATKYAEVIILTDDNPRFENPDSIMDDISKNIATFKNLNRIHDRYEAIKFAISQATEQDLIIITGKGHEDYQEIRGVRQPLSDFNLIKNARKLT